MCWSYKWISLVYNYQNSPKYIWHKKNKSQPNGIKRKKAEKSLVTK